MGKKTLLIITPGTNMRRDCVFNLIVAETGEHLASNLCSNYAFAESDLYSRHQERVNEYRKRFGEVEIKFINETDISEDELIKRNKEWFKSIEKKVVS